MNLNWKRPLFYCLLPILVFLAFVGFPPPFAPPRGYKASARAVGSSRKEVGEETLVAGARVGVEASTLRNGPCLLAFGRSRHQVRELVAGRLLQFGLPVSPNPSIERTASSRLRRLAAAAHVER